MQLAPLLFSRTCAKGGSALGWGLERDFAELARLLCGCPGVNDENLKSFQKSFFVSEMLPWK